MSPQDVIDFLESHGDELSPSDVWRFIPEDRRAAVIDRIKARCRAAKPHWDEATVELVVAAFLEPATEQ